MPLEPRGNVWKNSWKLQTAEKNLFYVKNIRHKPWTIGNILGCQRKVPKVFNFLENILKVEKCQEKSCIIKHGRNFFVVYGKIYENRLLNEKL